MNNLPSKAAVEARRARYTPGTRVELTEPMDDPYTTLKPGDRATVTGVDCHGDILCAWDRGGSLKLIPGVDEFKFLGSGVIPLTDRVFKQIMSVRSGASCNMFDLNFVQRAAYDNGFFELVLFIEEHKADYVHFIFTGERGEWTPC